MSFYIHRNDTAPALQATLRDYAGTVINLTGATVTFTMVGSDGTKKVNRQSATVVDAAGGIVKYVWQVGDTNEAGSFKGQWEVTYSDLTKQTFPQSHTTITISGDLDET